MYTSWRILRSQAFPFNWELVYAAKMMSRLQLGLWSGRVFSQHSPLGAVPLTKIEGVGRQKEEETIGVPHRGEHQSASLVIVWAMSNAGLRALTSPDIMRNERRILLFYDRVRLDEPFAPL